MKTKFIIKRNKWLRGEGSTASYLLRPYDGKMCCLGQIARQCGLKKAEVMDQGSPRDLPFEAAEKLKKHLPWLFKLDRIDGEDANSKDCQSAMLSNDSQRTKDEVKERRIKSIFEKHGVTLIFE